METLNASGLWTGGHLGIHFKLFLTFLQVHPCEVTKCC